MGSPGAGKTSVGRILGGQLGRKVIDVDDDVLENVWGMTVAEKVVGKIFTIKIYYNNFLQLQQNTCAKWMYLMYSKVLPGWGRRGRGQRGLGIKGAVTLQKAGCGYSNVAVNRR